MMNRDYQTSKNVTGVAISIVGINVVLGLRGLTLLNGRRKRIIPLSPLRPQRCPPFRDALAHIGNNIILFFIMETF
jgi:hypothetical protein